MISISPIATNLTLPLPPNTPFYDFEPLVQAHKLQTQLVGEGFYAKGAASPPSRNLWGGDALQLSIGAAGNPNPHLDPDTVSDTQQLLITRLTWSHMVSAVVRRGRI